MCQKCVEVMADLVMKQMELDSYWRVIADKGHVTSAVRKKALALAGVEQEAR